MQHPALHTRAHKRFGSVVFLGFLFLFMSLDASAGESSRCGTPPGYYSTVMQVKFKNGTDASVPEQLLPPDLRVSVASITRLFSGLSKEKLDKMNSRGSAGENLPDLNLWFQITLKSTADTAEFAEKLKRLKIVETVQFSPSPVPTP